MINAFVMSLIAFVFLPASAAVIGDDNMTEYKDLSRFSIFDMAKATATQIQMSALKPLDENISIYPSGELHGLCPGERFAGTRTLGGCSGFLIESDVLVTAGHCFNYRSGDCSDDAWVFNHFSAPNSHNAVLRNHNIFRCKEVIDHKHDGLSDYAVLKLDRPVLGALPFSPNLEAPKTSDALAALGYPLGLPFTYTPGGTVISYDPIILKTTLDVHSKNSGSVVVNMTNGLAEGIVTNGTEGLSINPLDGCRETKHHSSGFTFVNRLSQIPYVQNRFKKSSLKKTYVVRNACLEAVHVVAKYRSVEDNSFSTQIHDLSPNESFQVDAKSGALYLHAKGGDSGKILIRGKDFYGFENASREEELGFQAIEVNQFTLCQP